MIVLMFVLMFLLFVLTVPVAYFTWACISDYSSRSGNAGRTGSSALFFPD